MINPSGIQRPPNVKIQIDEPQKGLYSFQNVYQGEYEYFTGRPLHKSGLGDQHNQSSANADNSKPK